MREPMAQMAAPGRQARREEPEAPEALDQQDRRETPEALGAPDRQDQQEATEPQARNRSRLWSINGLQLFQPAQAEVQLIHGRQTHLARLHRVGR